MAVATAEDPEDDRLEELVDTGEGDGVVPDKLLEGEDVEVTDGAPVIEEAAGLEKTDAASRTEVGLALGDPATGVAVLLAGVTEAMADNILAGSEVITLATVPCCDTSQQI